MKGEESSFSLASLLSLLFLFLSFFTLTVQGRTVCSSVCGNITDIRYPFRLESDPLDCGVPVYQLSCENDQTILNFLSGRYYVKRISYEERVIRLVDFNLADVRCSLPFTNLSMADVLWDGRYSAVLSYHHVNFLTCSKNLTDPAYTRVPCLSGNAHHVFVNISNYYLFPDEIPASCEKTSWVPTVYDESKKNLSYETISKMLEEGFDVGWTVDCWYCKLAYGDCYLKSEDKPYRYNCSYDDDYVPTWQIILAFLMLILIGLILLVRFILAPLVVIGIILHMCITTRKKNKNVENFAQGQQFSTTKRYSYADVMSMTNNLEDKLGQGGFGSVYRGQLPGGCFLAVKLLGTLKVREEDFINEVAVIGRIRHANVVQLVGFCSEGSKCALLYEYMPNGSLEKNVFSKRGKAQEYSWEKLQQIALGMARGIEFLCTGDHDFAVHLDIKPQNVLLDQNFIPKIADFGLAKLYPKKSDFVSMCATGEAIRYMAPEMISRDFGEVSIKSDVYSFGTLLLEMASRKRNVDVDSCKMFFPSWVYDQLEDGGETELLDSEAITAKKLLIIGLWCTQVKASDRPSMSRVIGMLQGSIYELEMPPKPFLSTPQYTSMMELQLDSPNELLIISESMEKSS
ncbi:hypothetical protein SLEP1_g4262 [Rubroshorea leprosula]|uniref:non-specific serine/threonine protein kinase n=1 Tax=Rubroshorea leprosula TaxID=152421 RepID=A0AAV5HUK7_9ROSI|nr:hypothetical protein SLEP1_g4262 [Rubroshorea leprosula]